MSVEYGYSDELLLRIDLFKNDRDYRFIAEIPGKGIHLKQFEALILLTDAETVELLYGGAAGGAKSWTGCAWLLFMALAYPDTMWFIGREELKRLRSSTLRTFFKVAKEYGARRDIDFKYNGQDHYIQFSNGSRIDLLDLKYLPSDALYERYGSVEYTGGWIEEGGEVNFGAYDTLKSRIGRHLNDKYGILRKLLITCNPKKNWVYTEFYSPFKQKKLPEYKKFLQVYYKDNPHLEQGYEAALNSIKDRAKRERLRDGNFEYDDDPSVLCDYNAVLDLFTNNHVKPDGNRYASADLAMKGRDRFVAGAWDGFVCRIPIDQEYSTGKSIETDLKNMLLAERIGRSQCIADSDGLGAYLESYLEGIKEFHGGSSAVSDEYFNIKTECAFKLAELVNNREIKIICTDEQQQAIIEEFSVLREKDVDADEKKKRIIGKDEMKELLQRSPDYLDMLLMRMYFEVVKDNVWGMAV